MKDQSKQRWKKKISYYSIIYGAHGQILRVASEIQRGQITRSALEGFAVLLRETEGKQTVQICDKDSDGGKRGRLGRFRGGTQGKDAWNVQRHRRVDGKVREPEEGPGRGGGRDAGAGRPPGEAEKPN